MSKPTKHSKKPGAEKNARLIFDTMIS